MDRNLLPAAVLALALVAGGCGDQRAAGGERVLPALESVPGAAPRVNGIAPIGDVDGDGTPDVALSGADATVSLLVSGRGGRLVRLSGTEASGVLPRPRAVAVPLGDLDRDGRDDLALVSDRDLAVHYGRPVWPARMDVRRPPARHTARVTGSARLGPPRWIARSGTELVIGPEAWDAGAFRLPVPARGETVALADGDPVRPPPIARGEEIRGGDGPWGNGSPPVLAWVHTRPGSPQPIRPLVRATGREPWLLEAGAQVQGLTPRAALVVTDNDAPNGEAVEYQLVLHRLDADGETTKLRLTPMVEPFDREVGGSLVDAGRCVLVSAWMRSLGGPMPTTVLAIDLERQRVLTRWELPRVAYATAQVAGSGRVAFVGVDEAGRLVRGGGTLPADCS